MVFNKRVLSELILQKKKHINRYKCLSENRYNNIIAFRVKYVT